MSTTTERDYYPTINFPELRLKAEGWADKHHVISKIELYRAKDDTMKFILWVTAPAFKVDKRFKMVCRDPKTAARINAQQPETGKKDRAITEDEFYDMRCRNNPDLWDAYGDYDALREYYNWVSPDCLHVAADLVAAQTKEAPHDPQKPTVKLSEAEAVTGWVWITAEPGERPTPDDVDMKTESRVLIFENVSAEKESSVNENATDARRARMIEVAKKLWAAPGANGRFLTSTQICTHPEMQKVARFKNGKTMQVDAIWRTIKGLNPDKRPGNRPKVPATDR